MITRRAGLLFVLAAVLSLTPSRGLAGPESIVGKWLMKAETPQGVLDLQLDVRQENGQLAGSVTVFDSTVSVTGFKFEEPQLEMQLPVFEGNYKILGTLKDSKLSGTWEQIGGEMKGTWTAEKSTSAAGPVPAAAGAIDGMWNATAESPEGTLTFMLDLKQSGETFEGKALAGGAAIPLARGRFTANRMVFEIDYQGGTYRVEGTLAGDKVIGKWSAVAEAESGAFSAERPKR